MLFGNTYPDNPFTSAIVEDGTYDYTVTTYHGYTALVINAGGNVPIVQSINPSTGAVGTANGIFVHKGYYTASGVPGKGSVGCLTVNYSAMSNSPDFSNYERFIANFKPGQRGKITIERVNN